MIIERVGDVLQSDAGIIAHQTNCRGVMGAGVALQIKKKLLKEGEYEKYVDLCHEKKPAELLGTVQLLDTNDGRLVANVFGEDIPTGTGLDTNYEALRQGLHVVRNIAEKERCSVAVPGLMGCGLAGGDWNVVRQMLVDVFGTSSVKLEIVFFSEDDYNEWTKIA